MKVLATTFALAAAQADVRGFTDSLADVGLNDILSNYDLGSYDAYGNYDSFAYGAYDTTGDVANYDAYAYGGESAFADYEDAFNAVEAAPVVEDAPVVVEAPAVVESSKDKVRPGQAAQAEAPLRGMGPGGSMGQGDGLGAYKYCPKLTGQTFTESMTLIASGTITDPTKFDDCDVNTGGTQLNNQVCQFTVRQIKNGGDLKVWSQCSTVAACRANMAHNYDANVKSLSHCRDTRAATTSRFFRPTVCHFCSKLAKDADRNNPFASATEIISTGGVAMDFYGLAKNAGMTFGDVKVTVHEEETGADTLLGTVFGAQTYSK